MRANLTESIKTRILHELRQYWSRIPGYAETLAPNIHGKYSFKERPGEAIILKSTSASPFQFSADHFVGHVHSYCSLLQVETFPGTSLEWVREDALAIMSNGGAFPSAQGIYYIRVETDKMEIQGRSRDVMVFYVDPALEVQDEAPLRDNPSTFILANESYLPHTLSVFEVPSGIQLKEGVHYEADPETGIITLSEPLPHTSYLSVDYKFAGETQGPYLVRPGYTNVEAIPGVVLAFGKFAQDGDVMAVKVEGQREVVALEYGGRWDISLDFDIMSTDVNRQAEIVDRTAMWLLGVLRTRLSSEGIELSEITIGSDGEEIRDENGDDYFFTGSISMNAQTDWSLHVPVPAKIKSVIPTTKDEAESLLGLSNEDLADQGSVSGIKAYINLRLLGMSDPFFTSHKRTFETIK